MPTAKPPWRMTTVTADARPARSGGASDTAAPDSCGCAKATPTPIVARRRQPRCRPRRTTSGECRGGRQGRRRQVGFSRNGEVISHGGSPSSQAPLDEFRIQAGKRLPTDALRNAVRYGTVGPRRQLLSAPNCFLRACGLTHWRDNLVFFFDDDELNRCVSDICKLVPRGRRHI